jgi:hypothetical protein
MRIAGYTTGKQGTEVEYVRSVTLVSRWIHEMFESPAQTGMGGKAVVEPEGRQR